MHGAWRHSKGGGKQGLYSSRRKVERRGKEAVLPLNKGTSTTPSNPKKPGGHKNDTRQNGLNRTENEPKRKRTMPLRGVTRHDSPRAACRCVIKCHSARAVTGVLII